MIRKILVAIDCSAPATRAIDVAVELAGDLDARLAAVHVVDASLAFVPELGAIDSEKMAALRRVGETAMEEARARVPQTILFECFLVQGDPAEEIIHVAEKWPADLVVIGSDSRGRLAHFLLGSTADSVIRKASCPVVSVRADVPTPARKAAIAFA